MNPQTKLIILNILALNLSLNLETIMLSKMNQSADAIPTPAMKMGWL